MATNVQIQHPTNTTFDGKIAGLAFVNGVGTLPDDTTPTGKKQKAFFLRHGYAVGATAAIVPTADEGKPVASWTAAECRAYLDEWLVQYPSGAPIADLRNAVLTAFEIRAQGGSATLDTAGHIMGTFPVEGAPIVPGDDATKAALWKTPQVGNTTTDVAPTISAQPSASPKVEGATATYSVTAAGTPTPTYQWQRQTRGSGSYVDITGATSASYTTPALTVAENHNDRYRVVVSNSDGVVTSTSVQQVVTAS